MNILHFRRFPKLLAVVLAGLVAAATPCSAADAPPPSSSAWPDDFAAFESQKALAPAVVAALDAWHAASAPRPAHAVRRITLAKMVTTNGRTTAQATLVQTLPADHPSWVTAALETTGGPLALHQSTLSWRGLITIDNRLRVTLPFIPGVRTLRVLASEIVLPDAFDVAIKPGASWSYQVTTRSGPDGPFDGEAEAALKTRVLHFRCVNSAPRPASTVSGDFTGTMVAIRCEPQEKGDATVTSAWLEDEGVFVPMETVRGEGYVDTYAVTRVER